MNTRKHSRYRPLAWGLLLMGLAVSCPADLLRTQTIQLNEGWNAVFLEVHPQQANPGLVFSNTPIDRVAAHYEPASPAQFVNDPGADLFREAGWGVWYANDRPDAFLKTLSAIYGQQAYLIHSKTGYQWEVTGEVSAPKVIWKPDAYNFVGFSVHATASPTYRQFFAGSQAHRNLKIYRLINGSWSKVLVPDGVSMKSGEAFWIYCDGSSKYQGPVRTEVSTGAGLILGLRLDQIILRNDSDHPVATTIEHVPSGSHPVPLSILVLTVGGEGDLVKNIPVPRPATAWSQTVPPLEAGAATRMPFQARLEEMTDYLHSSLLKISSDLGTETWIPVVAIRKDLKEDEGN